MNCQTCGRELIWSVGDHDIKWRDGIVLTVTNAKVGNCGNGCPKEVTIPAIHSLDVFFDRVQKFENWRPKRYLLTFDEGREEWVIRGLGF